MFTFYTKGWTQDGCQTFELQFIASLLQIKICIFATVAGRTWIFYNSASNTQECMAGTRDYQLHLYHNTVKDHFDQVVFNA